MWSEWSPLKKLIWLRKFAVGVSYILKTVTGAIVHIMDAIAGPVEALSVSVEPVQNLNGYDNPWPAGGGKNLFDMSWFTTRTVNDVTFTKNSDGSVTLSGTASSTININGTTFTLPAGTYTISGSISNNQLYLYDQGTNTVVVESPNGTSRTVTTTEDKTVYLRLRVGGGSTVSGTVKPQLEVGSTATAYASYSNICPITGWDSVKVNRTGKNLLDLAGTFTSVQYSSPVTLPAGEYYVYVFNSLDKFGYNSYLQYFDGIGYVNFSTTQNEYGYIDQKMNYNVKKCKAVLNKTCTVRQMLQVNSETRGATFAVMLTKDGSNYASVSNTPPYSRLSELYEPYTGQTVTIDLNGTVYGGTLDVIAGKMTVNRVGITPTIDLLQSINTYGIANFRFGLSAASTKAADQAKAICSALKYQTTLIAGTTEPGFILSSASMGYLRIPQEIANTKETAQSWVSTNNVIVVYYLATPFELTLTPEQISTLQGTNNVWSDAGDVTVTYRASAS